MLLGGESKSRLRLDAQARADPNDPKANSIICTGVDCCVDGWLRNRDSVAPFAFTLALAKGAGGERQTIGSEPDGSASTYHGAPGASRK
jgi:hypothetical protein